MDKRPKDKCRLDECYRDSWWVVVGGGGGVQSHFRVKPKLRLGLLGYVSYVRLIIKCKSNPNFQTIQTSNLALGNERVFDRIRTPPSYLIGLMFP